MRRLEDFKQRVTLHTAIERLKTRADHEIQGHALFSEIQDSRFGRDLVEISYAAALTERTLILDGVDRNRVMAGVHQRLEIQMGDRSPDPSGL